MQKKKTHFTGIEGVAGPNWHSLGANLNVPAKVLQLNNLAGERDLNTVVDSVIDEVHEYFGEQKEFLLAAHSFGTLVALKIASRLEKLGRTGRVVLIDGSPEYLQRLTHGLRRTSISHTDENFENELVMILFNQFCSTDHSNGFGNKIAACDNLRSKIELVGEFALGEFKTNYSKIYLENIILAILNRLRAVMSLSVSNAGVAVVLDSKLKSPILLIRPTQATFIDIVEDYNLDKYTENAVKIKYVEGNHLTVLDNIEITNILNDLASQVSQMHSDS